MKLVTPKQRWRATALQNLTDNGGLKMRASVLVCASPLALSVK